MKACTSHHLNICDWAIRRTVTLQGRQTRITKRSCQINAWKHYTIPKCVAAISLIQVLDVLCNMQQNKNMTDNIKSVKQFCRTESIPKYNARQCLRFILGCRPMIFQILPLYKTLKLWRKKIICWNVWIMCFYWIVLNPTPHISPVAWITTDLWIF